MPFGWQRTALAIAVSLALPASTLGDPPPPAPSLTLAVTRTQFAVAPAETAVAASAPRGTTFVYTLSTAAGVSFAIERLLPGRRSAGGECHKIHQRTLLPPPGPPRIGPKGPKNHCHIYEPVATLTRNGSPGPNALPFSGRIGAEPLRPDVYRVTATAQAPGGPPSPPRRTLFTIVKRASQVQLGG